MVLAVALLSWGPAWEMGVCWRLGRAARSLGRPALAARRAEKSLERSRDRSQGRGAPTRFVALRRPALAVGHGLVARGRARAALF